MAGKTTKGIAGFYYIHNGKDQIYECRAKGVFRDRKIKPLVGDSVEFPASDQEAGGGNVDAVLPRSDALVHPVVADVDQALMISVLTHLVSNLNLLDRFLVTMGIREIPVVMCSNEVDLGDENLVETCRKIYEMAGYRVTFISTYEEIGLEQVREIPGEKTTVLTGPSGVGKSLLANRIQPRAAMGTGDVSQKIERGEHTIHYCKLFYVKEDTYMMDTPGFSSMLTSDLETGDLKDYSPGFSGYEDDRKFLGHVHTGERVCGVKEALKADGLSRNKYDNYLLMYEELKNRRRY